MEHPTLGCLRLLDTEYWPQTATYMQNFTLGSFEYIAHLSLLRSEDKCLLLNLGLEVQLFANNLSLL